MPLLTDLWCLDGSVGCSRWYLESLSVELEVMDQGLHGTLCRRRERREKKREKMRRERKRAKLKRNRDIL